MALITCTIGAAASSATLSAFGGLEWPPVQPIALPAPSGTDPTLPYPERVSVTSIEYLSASSPTLSPENRVVEYLDSRTETIRALVNVLAGLANLIPYYFIDRDGESNVTVDSTDPDEPVTTAAPSFMRRDLDMGGFVVADLAPATSANDLIQFEQMEDLLFEAEDEIEQILDTQIIKLDGTITMGADLDMDGQRVVDLGTPTLAGHAETKGHFDPQITSVQTTYLARTGILAMTGALSFQLSPITVRYRPTNVGYPTLSGDLANLFYLNEQIATVGLNDIPVGALQPFFGSTVPTNFLLCDGREVSRTVYQNLFLIIGVAYGTPTNVNVFKLPDLRGRTIIGKDNMGGVSANVVTNVQADALGGIMGTETHALTIAELAPHEHTFSDANASAGTLGVLLGADSTDSDNTIATTSRTSSSSGSGTAHANVQPSMAVNYVIRH